MHSPRSKLAAKGTAFQRSELNVLPPDYPGALKKSLDYVLQGVQVRAGPRVQRHLAEVQLPQDEGAEAEKVEAASETEENQRI